MNMQRTNAKQIRELARVMAETGLTLLEVTENDTKIRLERAPAVLQTPAAAVQAASAASVPAAAPAGAPSAAAQACAAAHADDGLIDYKSPMVGVFYASPAPDAEAFVRVGTRVKKGAVLGVVEAMKLMNELTADMDCEVAELCVDSGQVVEYGQTLFRLRPAGGAK